MTTNNEALTQKEKIETLCDYLPEGNKKAMFLLVNENIMGFDKQGNQRPFNDMLFFLTLSKSVGLDPIKKEIIPVYHWNGKAEKEVLTPITTVAGLRTVASRGGEYLGSSDVKYKEDEKGNLISATITVYKASRILKEKIETTATAYYKEFGNDTNNIWKKMPKHMLGKCAEALALRKAFPTQLNGLYTTEEMGDNETKKDNEIIKNLPKPKKEDKQITYEPIKEDQEKKKAIINKLKK